MEPVRFEHFLTFLDGRDLEEHLVQYRTAGFAVAPSTVRHAPGLRTGFIHFGPDYIEFAWVEDEGLFAAGGDPLVEPRLRQARRPHAIGLLTYDIHALRENWTSRGLELPEPHSGVPRDAAPGTPPRWTFLEIPDQLTPGAQCFALVYHFYPKGTPRRVEIAPNTTYAISGVSFVSDTPGEQAEKWRDLLAPGATVDVEGAVRRVRIGPHLAVWMTPQEYHEVVGLDWAPSPHPFGEMAVYHLLAEDLTRVQAMLEGVGRRVERRVDKPTGQPLLVVPPDAYDGLTFAVAQQPLDEWRREREGWMGETLEIVREPSVS